MTSTDRIATITTAEPEQRLLAALLVDAQESCRAGDGIACEWITRYAASVLLLIAGERDDVDQLAGRLLPVKTTQLRLTRTDGLEAA